MYDCVLIEIHSTLPSHRVFDSFTDFERVPVSKSRDNIRVIFPGFQVSDHPESHCPYAIYVSASVVWLFVSAEYLTEQWKQI